MSRIIRHAWAASNAFVLAARLYFEGRYSDVFILLDGDVYRNEYEKGMQLKKFLSGTRKES